MKNLVFVWITIYVKIPLIIKLDLFDYISQSDSTTFAKDKFYDKIMSDLNAFILNLSMKTNN